MKMKKTAIIGFIVLYLVTAFYPGYVLAQNHTDVKYDKVIIYMIDNLTLNDITPANTPFLWKIQNEWGTGLLNTSAAKDRTIKNACATLSAGESAVGSSFSHLNFGALEHINGETAGDIFFRNTGIKPQDENILAISFFVMQKNNSKRDLGEIGVLGEKIKEQGYNTWVIGNADRLGYHSRPGAVILMDKNGIIDQGSVDKSVRLPDKRIPTFIWTDYDEINDKINEADEKAVILIEYGDLARLEAMSSLFSPLQYNKERKKILHNIDDSIRNIETNNATEKSCSYIINLSPSAHGKNPEGLLTPVFIRKSGQQGLLTSFSTRREGIITLYNLHNSVLSCVVPEKNDPVYAIKSLYPLKTLQKINQQAVFNYINQTGLLLFFALLAIFSMAGVFLSLYFNYLKKYSLLFLSLPLSIPPALLIMSFFKLDTSLQYIIISSDIIAAITGISLLISRNPKTSVIEVLSLFTIFLIASDVLLGLNLIKNCIMSYQLISGIRYYGLGNEYMGILLGCVISFAVLSRNRSNTAFYKIISFLLFFLSIFILASPAFGINVGGTITACIALSYTWLKLNNHHFKTKDMIWIIMLTIMVISVMILADLRQPFNMQSHLGNSIRTVIEGGFEQALRIIREKLFLHLRIINYTKLSWVFLALLLTSAVLVLKPSSLSIKFRRTDAVIFTGIQGLLLGAVVALIFNDSGIIPAAYLFWYALTLGIYMTIKPA